MAEVKQQAVCNLSLNETELLLVYDGMKSLMKQVWSGGENVPLEFVFAGTDLLRTLTGPVNEILIARQQAGQQSKQSGNDSGPDGSGSTPVPDAGTAESDTVH